MAINFIGTNPALNQFNARMSAGDAARRQEEQDFTQRMQLEQQQGADTGLRNAISAYYAQNRGGAAPGTAAQPPMAPGAPVPNPAATTPIVSPDQSMAPADNPDYGGPTRTAPMPNATPRPGVDVPATVPMPTGPSGPVAGQPVPMPGGNDRSGNPAGSFGPMMDELAKQPGSGKNMLSLFSTDVSSQRAAAGEERKMQVQALKEFGDAAAKGQFQIAAAINQRFKLGMPEEAVRSPGFMTKLGGWMAAWKDKMTPEQNMAGAQAYLEGLATGVDENTAIRAGIQAARAAKAEFEIKGTVTDQNNQVQGYDKHGKVKPLGVQARMPGSGDGAGGVSKQQQYAEWRIKTLAAGGMKLDDAKRLVAGGTSTRPVTAQQRLSLARQLMTTKGANYRPVYATLQDALAAVDAATASSESPTADPAAAEPASQGPAGAVQRMRFDANGNEIVQ